MSYFDIAVYNTFGMAKIESVGDSQNNFCDLFFVREPFKVVTSIEFPSLTILHHDVEVTWVIIDLVNLYNVRMFKLSESIVT